MNKSFCVLPFYRVTVRSYGGMSPCCVIQNFKQAADTNLEDFWSSPELNALRDKMLQGIKCSECQECYNQENILGTSPRTDSLRDHEITEHTDLVNFVQGPRYLGSKTPQHLEVHVSNLCNLKCLTCDPASSSAILSEDKILKISNYNQHDFELNETLVKTLLNDALHNGIEVLDLRGGESMLMPSIRKLLQGLPENHNIKTLRLQTNCTVLDDFWKEMLKKFPTVELMLSIDAVGDAISYIRYPAKWQIIEENVDYFLQCNNLKMYVNCTISNLNFLLLTDLVDWCRKKNIYFHKSICYQPEHYKCTNLPHDVFEHGLKQIANYPELANLTLTHDDSHWEEFCNIISMRDKHRGNSIFNILPQLKPYWKSK